MTGVCLVRITRCGVATSATSARRERAGERLAKLATAHEINEEVERVNLTSHGHFGTVCIQVASKH